MDGVVAIWSQVAPHLPPPADLAAAEAAMHHARTQATSVSFRARAYSHAWLSERGLPSGLPDALKPRAERLYPPIAHAVGISVNTSAAFLKPAAEIVQGAMEDAVKELHADGVDLDAQAPLVKQRMFEAKAKTSQQLFGVLDLKRAALTR